ncbi:MAG: helix-turn-helix transcriptional regulator [Eubacteriales bacterium]|nr:helix-turn-helix transcriptional regulator [Eubacteriales bacterium]MDD4323435.1 helix-turn-helix transcriptional regulator [Eubacteriales bacterium]MDD4541131.1 helix-turn-helix transcriptional regulator [Eubacteriales bacterium]
MGKASLDPQRALAHRLRLLRSDKKLRQADVAAALNISSRAYSNYERAYRMPDLRILSSLADYFNVSTDYLLGRTTLRYRYPLNLKALRNLTNGDGAVIKVAESQLLPDTLTNEDEENESEGN